MGGDRSAFEMERLRADRYKSWTSVAVALVGVMVASLVLYSQFRDQRSKESGAREFIELFRLQEQLVAAQAERERKMLEFFDRRLQEIERRLERLEQLERRRTGALGVPQPRLQPVVDKGDSHLKKGAQGETSGREVTRKAFSPLSKEYILPAIYALLGLILLSSAAVTLVTSNTARKDTALEMTKTLMSFFIGAATGQVS